jgi:mannose-6-phosphate isomerase-like protein (cupin superfamily)
MEGEGVQTVGDSGEFPVGPGDSIFIPMGTLHSTFNTGWKQLRILAIYCPGGAEEALRGLPDFAQLQAGAAPIWVRG